MGQLGELAGDLPRGDEQLVGTEGGVADEELDDRFVEEVLDGRRPDVGGRWPTAPDVLLLVPEAPLDRLDGEADLGDRRAHRVDDLASGGGVEREALDDALDVQVVEHCAVGADRDPGVADLLGDRLHPADGPAGDEHDHRAGRLDHAERGHRPVRDRTVGAQQRPVEVGRDEPGSHRAVLGHDARRSLARVQVRDATEADWPRIWPFFDAIVRDGETYAYPEDLTSDAARALWMESPPARTTVAVDDDGTVLGSAKMGPNRPGRGAHVATASFMVDPTRRRTGAGRALAEDMVAWARAVGYRAVQFNAVVETNTGAVALWRSLGFAVIGTVPAAFDSRTHGYVGLHVMHLPLHPPFITGPVIAHSHPRRTSTTLESCAKDGGRRSRTRDRRGRGGGQNQWARTAARPSSSTLGATSSAAAWTSGAAWPMATAEPAHWSISRSLWPSPTARVASIGTPSRCRTASRPDAFDTPSGMKSIQAS